MDAIGPLQLRVMHHIWRNGPATVRDVHAALHAAAPRKSLAYTTVLAVMRNLVRRDVLAQVAEGRAHRFSARIDERSYKLGLLRALRHELFAGDAVLMLKHLALDSELPAACRSVLNQAASAVAAVAS